MRKILSVRVLALLVLLTAAATATIVAQIQQRGKKTPPLTPKLEATVYQSPTCGCCGKWGDHLEKAGFTVKREISAEYESAAPRQRVPKNLRSCHTGAIGKYVFEGHVPADVIQQFLRESPDVVGLTVLGMPIGSPGMEGPNPRPYSILAFKADGTYYEYAKR